MLSAREKGARVCACGLGVVALLALGASGADAAVPTCMGKPATIVRGGGSDRISGTKGNDVIVSGRGDDVITSGRGLDRICAGDGDDHVQGEDGGDRVDLGPGADFADGGIGTDRIAGGPGRDEIVGDRGNDLLGGGGGGDRLRGELGDDTLSGGTGSDRLSGGLGNDPLVGGPGSDLLSGDQGRDHTSGGPGDHDVVTYAGNPGLAGSPFRSSQSIAGTVHQGDKVSKGSIIVQLNGRTGVSVDLFRGLASESRFNRKPEKVNGVEDVIGTPFADIIVGDEGPNRIEGGEGDDYLLAEPPIIEVPAASGFFGFPFYSVPGPPTKGDRADGGAGTNRCDGFSSVVSCGDQAPPAVGDGELTSVTLTSGGDGKAITVAGGEAENAITISQRGDTVTVRDPIGVTATGCRVTGGDEALCEVGAGAGSISVNSGPGADTVEVSDSLADQTTVRIDGDEGSDILSGGDEKDLLFGGVKYGYDILRGGGGNDALQTGDGSDLADGGEGSDLLIDGAACAGHAFHGGPGLDSVSFARTGGVTAEIGGQVVIHVPDQFALGCTIPDRIDGTVENLEGSPAADSLTGDGGPNKIFGRGGDDEVSGGDGDDRLVGGEGTDELFGDAGFDSLFAKDGAADGMLSCGPDGGELTSDGGDQHGRNCG